MVKVHDAVRVTSIEVSFTFQSHILARSKAQKFLGKLLWVCTANKVQGITLGNVCVCHLP